MESISELKGCSLTPVIITIGMYDGVHLGHQKVLAEAKLLAKQKNTTLLVVTFSNPPSEILFSEVKREPIYPIKKKCNLLFNYGADHLLLLPFTKELALLSAKEFLQLINQQQPFSDLVLGYDATLGSDQDNNKKHVMEAANLFHANVHYVSELLHNHQPVSSRRIREYLSKGEKEKAAALLGRNDF